MNDARLTLAAMQEIIGASIDGNLSIADRCALRAGLGTFIADIVEEYVSVFDDVDPYMLEKLAHLEEAVDACLGFDLTNGHDMSAHRVWALGSLATIENLMRAKFPRHWQYEVR